MSDEMTDSEMWRALHEDQAAARAVRRESGVAELDRLPAAFTVRKLTDYQFRINERVDVFPTRRRYHVLAGGRRGSYGREALPALLARLLKEV